MLSVSLLIALQLGLFEVVGTAAFLERFPSHLNKLPDTIGGDLRYNMTEELVMRVRYFLKARHAR